MKQPNVIPDKLVTTLFLINFPQAGYDESPVVLVDRWPRTKRAAASFQPVTRLHQTRVSGRHENSTKWLKRPFLLSVIWKEVFVNTRKRDHYTITKAPFINDQLGHHTITAVKIKLFNFSGLHYNILFFAANVNFANKTDNFSLFRQ